MSLLRRLFGSAAVAAGPPLSATIDLGDPTVSADPNPSYDALRAEGEVVYLHRHDFWIVLGHAAARQVFGDPATFSSAPYAFLDRAMLSADPPLHGPVRRVVGRAFGGETLRRLEATAAEIAGSLIVGELEVVGEFARPLSRRVAAALLGFDEATRAAIVRAEDAAAGVADPFPLICAAIDAVAEKAELMDTLLRDGAGLIGRDEALSLVRLLWLASTATTERTLAHCVLRLVEDTELRDRLAREPELVPGFVEEVLRLTPPENFITRRTVSDVTIGGAAIPAGSDVQICLPAANRDPAVFKAPHELRIDRAHSGHLSFGSGIHQCIGGPMTRRVVAAAMTTFVARAHRLRQLDQVKWNHALVMRAPSELRVSL